MSPTSMVPCSESHFTSAGFNVASSGNMAQILQFDKVLSQAPIGIALMDEEGVYEDVNAAYSHLYGYRQDELIGQSVTRIFLPAEHARVLALHRSFLEEVKALPGTWQAVRQDGTRISIKSVSIRIEGNDGKPRRLVFVTDVTKQDAMAESLRVQAIELSEQNDELKRTLGKNQAIINAIPDLIFTNRSDGTFLDVEASNPDLLLVPPELFLTRTVLDVMPPPTGNLFQEAITQALRSKVVQVVTYSLPIGDAEHQFEARFAAATQDTVISIVRDVTERHNMEEKLEQLAFYDPLTGLANRRLVLDRLKQAVNASVRTGMYGAAIFLDLDNFKPLNDLHGHEAGDLLLVEVAIRLRNCVRDLDTVGRFGGDEFVVMLNEIDTDRDKARAHAGVVAEKIRASLCEPYRLLAHPAGATHLVVEHRCTASVGLSVFGNNELSQPEVIRHADIAMYRSKEQGRNMVTISE